MSNLSELTRVVSVDLDRTSQPASPASGALEPFFEPPQRRGAILTQIDQGQLQGNREIVDRKQLNALGKSPAMTGIDNGGAGSRPCLITADEIQNPHTLDLWLSVNGVTKQRSNTRHMLFKIAQLIADSRAGMALEPGDIIATGTPSGVGAGRKPQEWLWPGDVIEAGVQHIGQIRHPVIAV